MDRFAANGITRAVLALCAVWLVAIGPIVHDLSAQGAPRIALTGALVDDGDIKIDNYLVGFDYTERDGHIYSDKAPGQEILAIPPYVVGKLVGAEKAVVRRVSENLTVWWSTLWTAMLPAVSIIVMVAVAAHRRGTPIPAPALATLAFGTMLLPFAANLYGHVLGAALGYGAWLVIDQPASSSSWRRGLVAGSLIGLAVTVEYPLAIVGAVLAGLLLVRRNWGSLVTFGLAGVPFAVLLAVYQNAAFGSPFSSGYQHKTYHEDATLFITGIPKLTTLAQVLFGQRGMLLFTPVVAVGLVGLVKRWKETRDQGAMVSLCVSTGFILLQAGWVNPWGGDGPGPRYVIPMLPFLGIGLAHMWRRTPAPIRRFVVIISVASMLLPTVTNHLMADGTFLLAGPLRRLVEDGPNPNVWTIVLGPVGWVVYAASVLLVGRWAMAVAKEERRHGPCSEAEMISDCLGP